MRPRFPVRPARRVRLESIALTSASTSRSIYTPGRTPWTGWIRCLACGKIQKDPCDVTPLKEFDGGPSGPAVDYSVRSESVDRVMRNFRHQYGAAGDRLLRSFCDQGGALEFEDLWFFRKSKRGIGSITIDTDDEGIAAEELYNQLLKQLAWMGPEASWNGPIRSGLSRSPDFGSSPLGLCSSRPKRACLNQSTTPLWRCRSLLHPLVPL